MMIGVKELRNNGFKNSLNVLAKKEEPPESIVKEIYAMQNRYMHKEVGLDLRDFDMWMLNAFFTEAASLKTSPERIARITNVLALLAERKQDHYASYENFDFPMMQTTSHWFSDPKRFFDIALPLLKTYYQDFDINMHGRRYQHNFMTYAISCGHYDLAEVCPVLMSHGAELDSQFREYGKGLHLLNVFGRSFKRDVMTLTELGFDPSEYWPYKYKYKHPITGKEDVVFDSFADFFHKMDALMKKDPNHRKPTLAENTAAMLDYISKFEANKASTAAIQDIVVEQRATKMKVI